MLFRSGGGGPLNWEGVLMAVVCGKVSRRAGKFSTKCPV